MSTQAAQAFLDELGALPGVVGALICDGRGSVVAERLPASLDRSASQRAAAILADNAGALASIGGPLPTLSVRMGDGRILVRSFGGGSLVLLCSPGTSTHPLNLLTAGMAPRLEKLVAASAPAATPPVPSAAEPPPRPVARPVPGALHQAVQRIEAAIARRRLDAARTRGAIALAAGFSLRCIDEETPDDPERLARLEAAAASVLGQKP